MYSLQFVFVGLCPQFMWCIGLSSCFYLYAGCILCISYVCWTLSSDDVVYSTLQRVILLFFFIYVQGEFLAISAGLCPQKMWCTPHYRGLSSCFSFVCRVYSLQFLFLLVLCPQMMWCTPLYRGISSILNLCGQFIRRLLASTLSLTGFPCPIDL